MKTYIHSTRFILTTATLLLGLAASPRPAFSQHGDDDGHGHGAEKVDVDDAIDAPDKHEGEVVQIDEATLQEFGILLKDAGPGVIGKTVHLPGEVVFNADLVAHVTPSVSGVVREANYSVGDRVKAGDVMAVLSSRELAAARSEYLASQARLGLVKESLIRDEKLLEQRIGSERQVLETRQAVREAEIALTLAEQNLHAIGQSQSDVAVLDDVPDTTFSSYELRSPLDGIVIAREITRGEVVSEQPEEPPFIVADVSSVWVNLSVYQRDLASVQPGMSVRIEFSHGIPEASGVVAFVSPSLDETTRTATARVVLENEHGQWRPGLFVTGVVTAGEASTSVVVPRSALQEVEGKTIIFIQDDAGFEPREVVLGQTGKDTVEILRGLNVGDRYVAENGFAVKAEMNKSSFGDGHGH